jgi:hypothetical protein
MFCLGSGFFSGSETKKNQFFLKQFFFQKIPKLKIYHAKWTLQIEVVNAKKIFVIIFSEFIL